jgi:hypothetical protein
VQKIIIYISQDYFKTTHSTVGVASAHNMAKFGSTQEQEQGESLWIQQED